MLQNILSEIYPHVYLTGIPTCESDLYRIFCASFSAYPSLYLRAIHRNANDSQTAKDVRADQETLSEIFERIEAFFRRLDTYTEVAPDQGMVDTITAIMVEVLNILAIATQEIKQGRISKSLL
jgi:hypothetical protein